MTFYEPDLKYIGTGEYVPEMIENNAEGEWATRDDAEQAAKDAVEMARLAQREIIRRCSGKIGWVYEEDPDIQLSQAIIERYTGGQG